MIRKHNKNLVNICAVSLVFSGLLLILSPRVSDAMGIASSISDISVSSGQLSGNAYITNDTSAFQSTKVTFGNANTISFQTPFQDKSKVRIVIGKSSNSTPISPLDFGTNVLWYDHGYGLQDPMTNLPYPATVDLIKNLGITTYRYPGGIPSDTFNWQNAIGPQNQRTENVVYQAQDTFLPTSFGPDEFGQFLNMTGGVGDITVNFGTGTAQEAANWVQYMTASSKNNYWGKLRAKNGHPAPYNIAYWEVGNEQESLELYWRSGSVVSVGNDKTQCDSSNLHLCEYVYGGITKFTNQKALGQSNHATSDGKVNQVFYAKYPPVVASSQNVMVNGHLWQPVNNINDASASSQVYEFNHSSGKILFGNGRHGAIPPPNSAVTISYESGPHDGFIQYYKLMKQADPNSHVCSSYDSNDFIQLMGSSNPYDCLVTHLYGEGIPSLSSSILFHNELMQQSYGFTKTLASEKAVIQKYAGTRAKNIQIAVTEYGVNALSSPANQPNYHLSQDIALFVANTLRIIINDHIPIADKHYLISYVNADTAGAQVYINSDTFANNAIISGPGNSPIAQPSADVIEAFSKLLYSNLIGSNILHNQDVNYSISSYPALSAIATTDKKGHEALLILNLSPTNNISAEIDPSGNYNQVNTWSLGANSFLAYNSASDPSNIGFIKKSSSLVGDKLYATFPPGSLTVLQFN